MNTVKKAVLILSVAILMSACHTKTEPCKNLGKINNIDDWLYQVHSNINSQCLFEMPVSQLERIWGLPIIDNTATNALDDKQIAIHMKIVKEAKTFYIIKQDKIDNPQRISFEIVASKKYREQHYHTFGGSVLKGVFPERLPRFDFYREMNMRTHIPYSYHTNRAFYDNHPLMLNKQNRYQSYHKYYWINSARGRNMPSLEISTGFIPTPKMIIFANHSTEKYDYYAEALISKLEDLLKK